ncbi:MAG: hypothetical protein LBH30_06420 [Prevotellaceae bacterium]|jgi:hypothetical protein|nr:hypothetical protein [Prevotellaceae bacterium]
MRNVIVRNAATVVVIANCELNEAGSNPEKEKNNNKSGLLRHSLRSLLAMTFCGCCGLLVRNDVQSSIYKCFSKES